MAEFFLVIGAIALAAIVAAFFAGRYAFTTKSASQVPPDQASAVDLARLQERERSLAEQVKRIEAQLLTVNAELSSQAHDLAHAREKSAADDAKISGLDKALARESELNTAAQQKLTSDLANITQTKENLQSEFNEQSKRLAAAEQLETELRGQLARAGQHITDRDTTIKDLTAEIKAIGATLATKESDLATAAERESGLNRIINERDEQLKGLQEQLKAEFENIANKVLTVTSDQMSVKTQESLTAILNPLRDRILEFQQKVENTHVEDSKQRSALEREIKNIAEANQTIGRQADDLTKALKGDSQLRGRWGEVRLEHILENSGLERGREFVVQGGDFNIKSEDGGSQRPDVIILLPEARHFVIDSKVSLVDYLDYESADTDDGRNLCLKKLLASVRGHIDGLAGKNYQYANAINSHDLVFMFMPIEGVAALVLQNDEHMFEYAWKRKIVMVSPATLFMAMQTVQSIWRYEHQSENAQAIADQAGQLYDKLAGVVGDFNEVSQKLLAAADAHSEAMKKLATGRGNALGRAQKLKSLGVASKKEIPAILFNGEKHAVEFDDDNGELAIEATTVPD